MYLVDLLAVGLGNQHRGGLLVVRMLREVDLHGQARDYSEEMLLHKFQDSCGQKSTLGGGGWGDVA